MISGNFRKNPALLTERVMGEEYGAWVIEYRLEDTDGATTLRVWMDQDSDQVKRVSRLVDGVEKPATVADYDALMASASVVPDTNDGLVANSAGTCTLGPTELDCETKSYKVWLGDREASLGVTQSAAVPGTDIAGEITAADGTRHLSFRAHRARQRKRNHERFVRPPLKRVGLVTGGLPGRLSSRAWPLCHGGSTRQARDPSENLAFPGGTSTGRSAVINCGCAVARGFASIPAARDRPCLISGIAVLASGRLPSVRPTTSVAFRPAIDFAPDSSSVPWNAGTHIFR